MTGDTSSLWELSSSTLKAAPLAGDVTYDACVVGGGIAGLTAAYLLAREGKRVVLLEAKSQLAGGETEFTTAHLAWYIDDTFTHVASARGDEVAKLAAASHRTAVDLIGQIAKEEGIDCDYKRVEGVLFPGADGPDTLHEEVETMTRLGLPFTRATLPFPGGRSVESLRFPDHAQFHPLKYLAELAAAVRKHGGVIHTDTPVSKVRGGTPCTVTTTDGRTVTAGAVVVATNSPFEGGTTLHTKVGAYLTYAFAAEVPKGAVPFALYWDTEDPYHYVRLQPGDGVDYLIVGGEDHKTGQADDQPARWDRLKAWAKERYPVMGAVRHHWSGQVFETPDGLGLIGPAPWNGPNVYVMTGDSGMGMTHMTLGARLVTDLIQGKPSVWAGVYSPGRLMPGAAKTYLEENLNLAAQYTDWLTGGDVKSEADIPPGHGATVRSGLTKLAVYKDKQGTVTKLSAVCPHMGCIVHWNPGEQTWDCPCHGSRYAATGKVLHGPAVEGLKKAAE